MAALDELQIEESQEQRSNLADGASRSAFNRWRPVAVHADEFVADQPRTVLPVSPRRYLSAAAPRCNRLVVPARQPALPVNLCWISGWSPAMMATLPGAAEHEDRLSGLTEQERTPLGLLVKV